MKRAIGSERVHTSTAPTRSMSHAPSADERSLGYRQTTQPAGTSIGPSLHGPWIIFSYSLREPASSLTIRHTSASCFDDSVLSSNASRTSQSIDSTLGAGPYGRAQITVHSPLARSRHNESVCTMTSSRPQAGQNRHRVPSKRPWESVLASRPCDAHTFSPMLDIILNFCDTGFTSSERNNRTRCRHGTPTVTASRTTAHRTSHLSLARILRPSPYFITGDASVRRTLANQLARPGR